MKWRDKTTMTKKPSKTINVKVKQKRSKNERVVITNSRLNADDYRWLSSAFEAY